jgi:hypothetical protein
MITEDEAIDLWRRALTLPMGLAIRTDHRDNLKARLYQVRARANDESLYSLQIHFSRSRPDWLLLLYKVGPTNTKAMQEADLDSL